MESKKMFYTMGEVTEMFDVSSSLIRYWEKHFSVIKPVRNKKGNRLFTPKDIENFKLIYHLVKERGMTLEGAKKSIRKGDMPRSREVELMDRLLNMRSLLQEVREVLKEGDEPSDDEPSSNQPETLEVSDSQDVMSGEQLAVTPASQSTPKRAKGDTSAEKELFAFYEQNLF